MELIYDAIFGLTYYSEEYKFNWLITYQKCLGYPLLESQLDNKTIIYSNY